MIQYFCTLQNVHHDNLVTICHHRKILRNYWLYSPTLFISHPDSFISQLEVCISSHLSYFSAISAISPFLSAISLLPHSLPSGKHLFSVSVTLLLSRYENTGQLRARESDWTTSCTKIHSKQIKDFKLETWTHKTSGRKHKQEAVPGTEIGSVRDLGPGRL